MDGIEQLTSLLINSGTAVAVIAYFMFRDYKFMDSLTKTIAALNVALADLKDTTLKMIDKEGDVNGKD